MSGEGKVVSVTGGSGYIAAWLVKRLLQSGYVVKATVRDLNDSNKTAHLLALDGAEERLHLFPADLLEEGSFDAAVDGCHGVFHTASPVNFTAANPQVDLINPAVKGTLNVLRSCLKVPSVKRVILTSSLATVPYTGKPLTQDVVVDESWFSDPAILEKQKLWYHLSKTLTEEAAWKFAKENKIDLVTINPAFVIGPLLQPTLNSTVEMIVNLIKGPQVNMNEYYGSVDVRDVADAHIQAFEIPSANGRYCLAGTILPYSDVLKIVHQLYPNLHLPEKCDDGNNSLLQFDVSKEKAKTLGINFTSLEVTLKDTIENLKEKGFLTI
uniref:Cinnamoyl-CoA reductase n=3 Tax=Rhizophora mucronata TaxID=61149 RepID=A0A2P2JKB3_RHIMU